MKINLGNKPVIYPQPVLIIASYNEDGTANAMNAAWGGVCDYTKISIKPFTFLKICDKKLCVF